MLSQIPGVLRPDREPAQIGPEHDQKHDPEPEERQAAPATATTRIM
jgi:hypothetical protein